MTPANGSHGGQRDGQRRESLPSALIQIGVVAVLLAGAVTYVVHRGQVRQQVDARMKAARAQAQRDNPADLRKALAELDALFQVDADAKDARALAAEVNLRLWLEHRQPGAEANTGQEFHDVVPVPHNADDGPRGDAAGRPRDGRIRATWLRERRRR